MSDQTGKTEEQTLDEMREAAENAFSNKPQPIEAEAKAPESKEEPEKPSVEGEPEQLKAEDPTPAPEVKSEVAEKYKGKSIEDLHKMLDDKDSYFGRIGSERAHERGEAEKLRAELDGIKADLVQKKTKDQEQSLRDGLEGDDPAKTLMNYVDNKFDDVENRAAQDKLDRQSEEAATYYRSLLDNPDFSRRKGHVDKVAQTLSPYIKDQYVKSKDFVEICDLISKGTDLDYYIERTKSEIVSQKEADLIEKREAQTVSGSSSGQTTSEKTADMSLEEARQRAIAAFAKTRG